MRIRRFLYLIISLSVICLSTSAQTSLTQSDTEKEKVKKELEKNALDLADEAVIEANSLKLWENRALIFAIGGDLVWNTDQKRARKLFRDAANELIQGATLPKEKTKDYDEEYDFWQDLSPRRSILLMIAARDADLALNLLQETRPPDLQAAINSRNQPQIANGLKKTSVEILAERKNSYKVQQEIDLEQNFAVKAAQEDPKKAAKLIRDSLSKGVSNSAIELVRKVNEKDEELGKELLGEVIQKLLDADFNAKTSSERGVGFLLLQQSASPHIFKSQSDKFRPLKIEDKYLKDIAGKIANFYLQATDFQYFFSFSQILPALEKYLPEKIALLKQKETAMNKIIPEEFRAYQETARLTSDPNISPEKLIDTAEKSVGYNKFNLYRRAIDKFLESGNGEKARQLLENASEGKQKDDALAYLDSKLSDKAIKDDKLDDAQKLIGRATTNSSKIKILVDLAIGFQKKNTEESHKTALGLMEDARRLVNETPESREEVADILKVASGFANIEPERAFPYLNPLIDMTNDLMTAGSLLAKYNKRDTTFKQGELIFTQILGGSFLSYGKELGALAKADFARTQGLIGQFRRNDVRVLAKILIAQSILKEKISVEGNNAIYFDNDF